MPSESHSPAWRPQPERVAAAQLTAFAATAEATLGRSFDGYGDLHRWSIENREEFWLRVWRFCGVRAAGRGSSVLVDGDRMPGSRWFPEARLNFAENLLAPDLAGPALIFRSESGARREMSWAELRGEVAALSSLLAELGVRPGDRVAALLPNVPEAVVAMLATASIGAVYSTTSPDFGVAAVLDRFAQIEPKVLFCTDGYFYNGRWHATLDKLPDLLDGLPSVEKALVAPYGAGVPELQDDPRVTLLGDELEGRESEPSFLQLPFDAPLYILFSSGTTGKPKCIVHSAGGTLLQHLKEHRLHVDLRQGDRFFYFTTCGWMMWNWLVSGLASGATLVLYDGSPFHPAPTSLFDVAESEEVSVFGISAKFLDACAKAGVAPITSHDLGPLRTMLSTGSPLAPEAYDYVYSNIKTDLHLASISGGTDIISCFVLGDPTAPVYRGEIQSPGLGMAVAVFDDEGRAVEGETGELVCTRSFPSMPLGFWGDADGARYSAAYFERFPGVWCHGDWTIQTERGSFVIYGRSDAVLNPGGVRIGTAEIYRQVEALDEVVESIAVGQSWESDVRVVLFVRLREGLDLDEDLAGHIAKRIRERTSPRHVPARILAVSDIPRTRSGKISEIAVRDVVNGSPVKNLGALANPEALEEFRDRKELRPQLLE